MSDPAASVFADPDAYATCLLAVGIDRFGADCLNWAPQTWSHECLAEFGVELPSRNLDRIAGACVVLTSPDEFYRSAAGFNDVAQAIAGDWFDPDVWHPPTTAECLWAAVEAYMLDPPDADDREPRFSAEIVAYVNAIAREEGFRSLPKEFAAFGIPDDPNSPPPDYTADPVLFAASESGAQGKAEDLSGWLSDRVRDLADRLRQLTLGSGRGEAVAAELERTLGQSP